MSFILDQTEEQRVLGETLRRLGEARNGFEDRRRRVSGERPDRLALWPALAEIGALGLAFPEAQGGFGGTATDVAVLQEALAPSLLVEPLVAATVTAGQALQSLSGAPAEQLIAATIAGERIPILLHAEGFDPFAAPRLRAVRVGEVYRLEGVKPAVRYADVATDLLVSARLEGGEVGLFHLDATHPGVEIERMRLIDAAGAADFVFRHVTVTPEARLGAGQGVTAAIANALEWTLVALCAETAALIGATNVATFAYLNMRQQFGQKLSSFQALHHRAADMAIAQTEAEALAMDAIDALGAPPSADRTRRILLASLGCDAAGRHVGHDAVQLHGGMGVSDELAISHYARRLTAIRHQVATPDARQSRLLALETISS